MKSYSQPLHVNRLSAIDDAEKYLNTGLMYYHGKDVRRDYGWARKYLKKAAERGSGEAEFLLGMSYYSCFEGRKNFKKAVRFFQEAAIKGNDEAEYMLGSCYLHGLGVKKDIRLAIAHLDQAARKKHKAAGQELRRLQDIAIYPSLSEKRLRSKEQEILKNRFRLELN
jgi:TPR repeat protein